MTDGPVFGAAWTPSPRTFLGNGASVQSLIATHGLASLATAQGKTGPSGEVLIHFVGRWNHGATDVIDVIVRPSTARELALLLADVAAAAERDVERWTREQRG